MNKFSTNVCPLCDKVTKFHKANGVPTFECHQGHYQVEVGKEDVNQNIYIDNMCLVNYDKANKSHVYRQHGNEWKLLVEIPLMYTADANTLRARLNKIISTL